MDLPSPHLHVIDRKVEPAAQGEFQPLQLGPHLIWPPVVLAPMAGVTNYPFRTLCHRYGAALCICEMITARPLVDRSIKTLRLVSFGPVETIPSVQLYGVDPNYLERAVRMLVDEFGVQHIDLNFGCPVRKVTRKGGGAAIPLKPKLLSRIIAASVRSAGTIPVTIKFRMGIDEELLTFRRTGWIAQEEGCAGICLHARTAAQLYDGPARWEAIAELKRAVTRIPVLGNGDIWEAEDALRMMRETGCDGVAIGRGCLGRPWFFRDLSDGFNGREIQNPPDFGTVSDVMLEHCEMLLSWLGEEMALRSFRRHAVWYTKGFRDSAQLRQKLMRAGSMKQLQEVLRDIDRNQPYPLQMNRVPRGKSAGRQRVSLPEGYLDHGDDEKPSAAEAERRAWGG